MIWRQGIVIGSLVLAAVIIELTLLSRLGLPGATPDLVVVTIIAIALAMGPMQGAAAGFAAGLLVDFAPPSDTLLGVNALVYIAVGFITGFIIDPRDRTVPLIIGLIGLATGAVTVSIAAFDALLGSARVSWDNLAGMVLTSALYAVIMAPFVVLGVAWLVRKTTPEILVV